MIKIITYGTFDMLHIGHINILTRAKAQGDYLIVGITSEDYDRSRGKLNVSQTQQQRVEAIKLLDFVDEIILETHKNQKKEDIVKHNIDKFVIGDDWIGKFDYLKNYTQVIYLPRTKGISSTQLRNENSKNINIGIVGINNDSNRFISESKFVSNVNIISSYSNSNINRNKNIELQYTNNHFNNYDDFLKSDIKAVYICSEIQEHYNHIKKALLCNKHILCENPLVIQNNQLNELLQLAKEKNKLLLMALKTAFLPAFNKLLEELNSGTIGEIKEIRSTFTSLYRQRGYDEKYIKNGSTNLLMSYPLLLTKKVAGVSESVTFFEQKNDTYDISNRAITTHKKGIIGISTVAVDMKSSSSAIISGTKGYIYIPAPWWLTKEFKIRFEDTSKEINFEYEFEGDGLRYMISEFISLIQRDKIESKRLSIDDMNELNRIIVKYNEEQI